MIEMELDGLEVDVLAHLLENGEQRFIEIAKAIFPKHAKTFHQDENHFKVVLVRRLDELKEDGLIEKKILSPKNVRYSIPNDKKEKVANIVKHHRNIEFLKRLPPEEIERLIKENERLKRLSRIHELEQLNALPLLAVVKKLVDEYGFKIEDFYDKRHLKDPGFQQMLTNFSQGEYKHTIPPDRLYNCYAIAPFSEDLAEIDNIEIKLVPESEVEEVIIGGSDGKTRKLKVLTPSQVQFKYGSGWIILTDKPINGYFIIGAWKELLKLYMEHFEDEWLKWKEEFNLSDEDWKRVGPHVAFIMMFDAGRIDLPYAIRNELYEYVQSFKPDGLGTLTQMYMRHLGAHRAEAEKHAKDIIEANKKFRELPVEEVWKRYEENVAKLGNEEWQRIFQYLKAKYGPSAKK